jgi:hypothetical protein
MLNRLSIPELTRYLEVVLTSWDCTNRNSLGKLHQYPQLDEFAANDYNARLSEKHVRR